ncbi:hypothetical protein EJ06DRAFT_549680 [Trichodelitschia bisporula]|uniref:Uncharacterized protein n=1 Tax=Trichodelitschia bisporula TaxID=703511 RepID=A0A6G1HUX4_9PEZI|nr:hypothetical protein EJ06DRAFT_549680 [Trichodelitschia bisporula]
MPDLSPTRLPLPSSSSKSNRRSLLLPKGTLSSSIRADISTDSSNSNTETRTTRARPSSLYAPSGLDLASLTAQFGPSSNNTIMPGIPGSPTKPRATSDTKPAPPTGRLTRSQSLRAPTSTRPAARNLGTSKGLTNIAEAPASRSRPGSIAEAPTSAPRSRPGSKPNSRPASALSSASASSGPPVSSAAPSLRRAATTARHARTQSVLAPPSGSSKLEPKRPAFSTLQQHFSPRKPGVGPKASAPGPGPAVDGFVDPLGPEWRAECEALGRRLAGLRRAVEGLDHPAEGSEVERAVRGVRSLVKGLAEEVRVVGEVERRVGEREREWVDKCLEGEFE